MDSSLAPVATMAAIEMRCKECDKDLPMLTPEAAAAFVGVSARAIYRSVESGELHFIDTSDGALLICSGSFLKYSEAQAALARTE